MLRESPELSPDIAVGPGRVALVIEYDGAGFHGWQYQKGKVRTISGVLHQAVAKVANHPVELVCAGRTDAGVHASYQLVHFDTSVSRPLRSWVLGINTNLPDDVRIHWAGTVPDEFSARFSATSRRYRYLMLSQTTPTALLRNQVSWTHHPLDGPAMDRAGQCLVGEQDFSAFRAAGCQASTPWREVTAISVYERGPFLVLDVEANAFLHHMVRNIAGTLMRVGTGEADEGWPQRVLASRDRREAGITAPPQGLYLIDVYYPQYPDLPRPRLGPALVMAMDGDSAGSRGNAGRNL